MPGTRGDLPRRTEPDEKELQELVEARIEELEPGLTLVDHYVPVGHGVIDSLCVDDVGAPVVVEYKAVEAADEEALVQGLYYAAWVDQNPDTMARFINQRIPGLLKEETPEASRIILVAPSFGERTLLAVTMLDVDIALKRYLCFEHESIGKWVHTETVYSSRQVQYGGAVPRTYSIDYHFEGNYARMRPLFDVLRRGIEGFGEVTTYAKKHYIAFKRKSIFAVAHVFVGKIELGIRVRPGTESPRLEPAEDWSWSWISHHLTLTKESDIDEDAMRLIKASHDWAK